MKRIGVLGGLGPQATMDFEARVHAVSQRLIAGHGNEGYPPMLVYYHRRPPVVMSEGGGPLFPLQIDPQLLDGVRLLGAWADLLVITSNGVHRLQPEIEAAAGRPVLSMIDATLAEVERRGWRSVGVLTYIEPVVYQAPLEARGLRCETVDAELQQALDTAMPLYVSGQLRGDGAAAPVRAAVRDLRGRGVDGIILGCTEFPLMLGDEAVAPDLINPIELLTEATVRAAIME